MCPYMCLSLAVIEFGPVPGMFGRLNRHIRPLQPLPPAMLFIPWCLRGWGGGMLRPTWLVGPSNPLAVGQPLMFLCLLVCLPVICV